MATTTLKTFRNRTIGGDICKQTISLYTQKGHKGVIHIYKVILAKSAEMVNMLLEEGFSQGRTFKDSTLMSQSFVIRVNILKEIARLIK